ALGITPVLTSFAIVELIALAVPRLRWRRHDPLGRVRLQQAVAAASIVVALVQGYFVALYLESASRGGAELVVHPGMGFRLLTMVTLAAGTMTLAVIAGMISVHGLGNGYGALLVSGWLAPFLWSLVVDPLSTIARFDRDRLFSLALVVAMMLITH